MNKPDESSSACDVTDQTDPPDDQCDTAQLDARTPRRSARPPLADAQRREIVGQSNLVVVKVILSLLAQFMC